MANITLCCGLIVGTIVVFFCVGSTTMFSGSWSEVGGWELVGFSELKSSSDCPPSKTVSSSSSGIHWNWGPVSNRPVGWGKSEK